jgi:ABC-type Fe3+-hydroxamate transport system substrate-binding protein
MIYKKFKFKNGSPAFRNHQKFAGSAISSCLNDLGGKEVNKLYKLIKNPDLINTIEIMVGENGYIYYKNFQLIFYSAYEDSNPQKLDLLEFIQFIEENTKYQDFRRNAIREDQFYSQTYNESKFNIGKIFFESVIDIEKITYPKDFLKID